MTLSKNSRVPLQLGELMPWIAARVSTPSLPCIAANMEPDGSMARHVRREKAARLRWLPPAVHHAAFFPVWGLDGACVVLEKDPEEGMGLARRLAALVIEARSVALFFVPGPGKPVILSLDGPGDLLQRKPAAGDHSMGCPDCRANCTTVSGSDDPRFSWGRKPWGVTVRFLLRLANPVPGAVHRPSDLRLSLLDNHRPPGIRPPYLHAVERLVGVALGRAFGRDPDIVLRGAAEDSPKEPVRVARRRRTFNGKRMPLRGNVRDRSRWAWWLRPMPPKRCSLPFSLFAIDQLEFFEDLGFPVVCMHTVEAVDRETSRPQEESAGSLRRSLPPVPLDEVSIGDYSLPATPTFLEGVYPVVLGVPVLWLIDNAPACALELGRATGTSSPALRVGSRGPASGAPGSLSNALPCSLFLSHLFGPPSGGFLPQFRVQGNRVQVKICPCTGHGTPEGGR